ncbi:MAG: hypothetical protein AAGC90_04495 [Curtobacterium sp.]|jgi:hypothetical protein|uniref:hypothetical protein n=1 Tax=Curtobacterium sp. Curtsp57 TaxID=3243047 RepID=UPI0031AC7C13
MLARLRPQATALVLLLVAGVAVLVAVVADHIAWPMAPAFPWLHHGDFAYVATKSQWDTAIAARSIARVAVVIAGLSLIASVVAFLRSLLLSRRT